MWVNRGEWQNLSSHVKTLNEEMGQVQKDMEWVKWLLRGIALALLTSNTAILLKLVGAW